MYVIFDKENWKNLCSFFFCSSTLISQFFHLLKSQFFSFNVQYHKVPISRITRDVNTLYWFSFVFAKLALIHAATRALVPCSSKSLDGLSSICCGDLISPESPIFPMHLAIHWHTSMAHLRHSENTH